MCLGRGAVAEDEVTCCYALQDDVWVDAPDGEPWEVYTVLADAGTLAGDASCCSSAPDSAGRCG
jgi:hypothetical protein